VLFVSCLHGVRRRPSWPTEPRATQSALALKGSLPGERSLDLRRAPRRNRSDWPPNRSNWISQRRCKERRCVLHVRVRSCVGPELASIEGMLPEVIKEALTHAASSRAISCKFSRLRSKLSIAFSRRRLPNKGTAPKL